MTNNKTDVEIKFAAALDALYSLLEALDGLRRRTSEDPCPLPLKAKTALVLGRDYSALAHRSLLWLASWMNPDDPRTWLDKVKNRAEAHEMVEEIHGYLKEAGRYLATANLHGFRKSAAHNEKHARAWDKIYEDLLGRAYKAIEKLEHAIVDSYALESFRPIRKK